MKKAPRDASHVVDLRLGGDDEPKPRRYLPKLDPDGPAWADVAGFHPVNSVPKTRGDCPDVSKKPCPHIHCRHHTYLNTDRAGRPDLASVPRDALGRTLSVRGSAGDRRSPTTLEGRQWLRWGEAAPSCVLAVIEQRGSLTTEDMAPILGRHRTLLAREIYRALKKLRDAGVTIDEFIALLDDEHGPRESRSGWWQDFAIGPSRRDRQTKGNEP